MSNLPDAALATLLSSIPFTPTGHKVRVLGKILVYDLATGTMLLMNEKDVILVDISLCTGHTESKEWLTEKRAIVSVIGYVEREPIRKSNGSLEVPKLFQDSVTLMQDVQLQALMVIPSGDVDIRVWNETVSRMEEHRRRTTAPSRP